MDIKTRFTEAGVVPILLRILASSLNNSMGKGEQASNKGLQEEVMCALRNLSLQEGNKAVIVPCGGLPVIIQVLTSCPYEEVLEVAAWTLHILSLPLENKVGIGAAGGLQPLTNLLVHSSETVQEKAAAALSSLALAGQNIVQIIMTGAVPPLIGLLGSVNSEVQFRAAGALANLCNYPPNADYIRDAGAVPPLEYLLAANSQNVRLAAHAALQRLVPATYGAHPAPPAPSSRPRQRQQFPLGQPTRHVIIPLTPASIPAALVANVALIVIPLAVKGMMSIWDSIMDKDDKEERDGDY